MRHTLMRCEGRLSGGMHVKRAGLTACDGAALFELGMGQVRKGIFAFYHDVRPIASAVSPLRILRC